MIQIEEHKRKMREISEQIKSSNSYYRKKDLRKQLNRLRKQLFQANAYIRDANKNKNAH